MNPTIILASSSKYRQELLSRLRINFQSQPPDIDESVQANETPLETCTRLAKHKALEIANLYPTAVVIGSDQVANLNGVAISKPGDHATATQQLRNLSGKTITFHSAVCVISKTAQQCIEFEVPTHVTFRALNHDEIERYLQIEKPYDCAGSAKSEGLGITLLECLVSSDPTALIGLPLIELSKTLRSVGIVLP